MRILAMCAIVSIYALIPSLHAQEDVNKKPNYGAEKDFLAFDAVNPGIPRFNRILRDRFVRREIEMTDQQYQKLTNLESKMGEEYARIRPKPIVSGMTIDENGNEVWIDEKETKEYKEYKQQQLNVIRVHYDESMKVLLPHQKKRLRELLTQRFLHGNRYPFGAYLNQDLAKVIDLTTDEKSRLKKEVEEQYAAYLKEIDELKRKYELKVRSVLPKHKQQKLDEAFGEPYQNLHLFKW
jgi:hypothetical protein